MSTLNAQAHDFPGIDYVGTGTGPAVLFVPGSFSTTAAWAGVQKSMPPRFRMATTSLCGYGRTAESRRLDDCAMHHETSVIAEAARRIGNPVHLVGHSFGGTVALAAALAGVVDVISLTLFEPNPMRVARDLGAGQLVDEAYNMSQQFEAAHFAGDTDAAGCIIDYWGKTGDFAALPPAVADYCRKTAFANVLDWRTAFSFHATAADLRRLACPTLVVRGGAAIPLMVQMTQALVENLPNARTAVVDGAGHFLINTHERQSANLLTGFIDKAESPARAA